MFAARDSVVAERLLQAGLLRHYLALIDGQFDEAVQTEAVHGLAMLPLNYRRDLIINQPGCLEGLNICTHSL